MKDTLKLEVARGSDEGGQEPVVYEVPYVEGMSVLDALMWIRSHTDPSLAFRYSCINANACKECSVLVDGEVVYACAARLTPQGASIKPLQDKALLRDLVTDIAPSKEHLGAALPRRNRAVEA
ncbi:hypothetical protein CSC67_15025 [Pusillimonas caeni]|uniref:2Fe-2S iron-sulfur cluster-binding protein n=1 Tax=Pusillimonas caeni TaxID=1348472 RepID=UPI000E59924F|nr:2Fe-2S iron-sulfur cluster-binding protein [Pusillimonas caeni]TFL13204.1 hypothetical protein CSC67_15025 [Pusillimonas caeni]